MFIWASRPWQNLDVLAGFVYSDIAATSQLQGELEKALISSAFQSSPRRQAPSGRLRYEPVEYIARCPADYVRMTLVSYLNRSSMTVMSTCALPSSKIRKDGTSAEDILQAASIVEDDCVVLAGSTSGSWNATNVEEYDDFAAVKLDASGKEMWRWQVQTTVTTYIQ